MSIAILAILKVHHEPGYDRGGTLMSANVEQLIVEARTGEGAALGPLLETYRNYLRLLARLEIGKRLQSKVDESDAVQEVFLNAQRYFPTFRGNAEGQFAHWLREILAGVIANHVRRYLGTQARNVRLEQDIAADLDRSSVMLDRGLAAVQSSPSEQADRHEQAMALTNGLAALPDDYREILVLRHFEGLTFPDAAKRMDRTVNSVEKLWMRALVQLRQQIGAST